jgi:hypothetical protein
MCLLTYKRQQQVHDLILSVHVCPSTHMSVCLFAAYQSVCLDLYSMSKILRQQAQILRPLSLGPVDVTAIMYVSSACLPCIISVPGCLRHVNGSYKAL